MALIPILEGTVTEVISLRDVPYYKSMITIVNCTFGKVSHTEPQRIRVPKPVDELYLKVGQKVAIWANPAGEVNLWDGEGHSVFND